MGNKIEWDPLEISPFESIYPAFVIFKWFHRIFFLIVVLATVYFFNRVATASRIHKNFRLVLVSEFACSNECLVFGRFSFLFDDWN